jgi:small subunit ribosomal protein S4
MSKRLLFKNKIVRFYEEDIWGIFFKKQQRRDIFLKKYIYIFFLARFVKELKKRRRLRRSLKLLSTRSLYINLRLKKKRYKYFLKKKKWKQHKRNYFNTKYGKYNNYKNKHKPVVSSVEKKKIYFSYFPKNFQYNKKQIKNILYLSKNQRSRNQFLFLLNHYKKYSIFKNKIIFLLRLKKIFYFKSIENKIKNKNKFLFFIRLNFNKFKFNLTYDFINFYFLYLKYKLNKILFLLNKEVISVEKFKYDLLSTLKLKYVQKIKLNTFNWNIIYLKYFKLTLAGKQLYLNFLINQNNINDYYYFDFINNLLTNKLLIKDLPLNNKIIFTNYFKNLYFINYFKKLIFIFNILIKNNNFLLLNNTNINYSLLEENNTNLNISTISVQNFILKFYLIFFLYFSNFVKNDDKYYFLLSKNILYNFNTYNKWTLRKFLAVRLRPFLKNKKRRQGALIFCIITLLNFTRWLKRKIKRFIYKIRNFYYYKYNNFEDNDSIFAGNKFDITKIDLSFIKTDQDRKNNFVLLTALENLKNNKNKPRQYVTLSKIITKPSITFSKTEYLLSFYASTKLYKFFKKLKVNYIKTMLLKRSDIVKELPYKEITKNNGKSLVLYSKYLNARIDNVSKKERFYSIKKKRTALQKMFTLNLVPIVKYVKKKKAFNSFYTYKMAKVWKIRKFYGCLTDYEFKRICTKALKFQGDVLIRFIILLESRIDTLLFRSGLVSSIFEARQFINHSLVLVNNRVIDKRSYTLKPNEMLSISLDKLNYLVDSFMIRVNNQNILFRPPIYLEVNYKYYLVTFLYDIINVNNIPYNFNITGKDLNTILYYYY